MNSTKEQIAVIFEVFPDDAGKAEYLDIADRLKKELKNMEGFISIERFQSLNDEGKVLSLSFWENEEAIESWRNQMEHRKGQKAGHDKLFKNYRIRVAQVFRDYTSEKRNEAPGDSNQYLKN